MYHLWTGVIAGVLLAYLLMRARALGQRKAWRSLRWWPAWFTMLIILLPAVWEFGRLAFGRLGPVEGLKSVLLPWAAGGSFGIWIYLAIEPLAINLELEDSGMLRGFRSIRLSAE